ncbi:methyltransferase domain-containing protein [Fluviicola sp.]|uniref:class I SAM-dependent DNA methyltransferase n=1 Tax=Fluviicola sp. TaxID=1917219 RepID=UPI0031D9FAAE
MENTENQKAVALFNKLAEVYQQKFFSVDAYKAYLDEFLAHIRPGATVLDAACGPGNISHYLLNSGKELQLTGIDLAPNMVSLASKNNPSGRFFVHDALKSDTLNQSFDALVAGFLFPYFSWDQVRLFLRKAHQILNPDGFLYLSTMEDSYEKSRMRTSSSGEQLMMYFYESLFLENTLEELGFEILAVHRQPYVLSETESDTDLIILARKIS